MRPDSHKLDVSADGKATFVEFLDFECEACRAAFPVIEQLRKDYAGKVTFVVRYFRCPATSTPSGPPEPSRRHPSRASSSRYTRRCTRRKPVLSCGSVMTKPQAEIFGFPNPLLGIAGFAVVTTVGAALLAGASFRRWFRVGLQAGVTFEAGFEHWLIFQSLYRIEALCPYCVAVWATTVPIFWYVTLHNLNALANHPGTRRAVLGVTRYHSVVLTSWTVVLLTLIGHQFWSYWRTLA